MNITHTNELNVKEGILRTEQTINDEGRFNNYKKTMHLPIEQCTQMKHLKISCQRHKIGSLFLSSRCMTNFMKTCSILHADFTESRKVVENLFKKCYGEKLIY